MSKSQPPARLTPAHTATPTYEGRILPRPTEEVVDQGLRFDVGTLLSRRRMLGALGVGAGALTLAACASGSSDSGTSTTPNSSAPDSATSTQQSVGDIVEIPEETAGPYPADGTNGPNALEESGIVRSDIRSSFGTATSTAEGVPLTVELRIIDMASGNTPFAGAAVYAWHCDRDGGYSMYSAGLVSQNYLRGVQVADSDGNVRFTSIFPACYTGRWPHIHFEVFADIDAADAGTNAIATSQLALPQDVCDTVYATAGYEESVRTLSQVTLSSDNVFGDDEAEHQLPEMTGSVDAGYRATLLVGIDTTTERTMAGGGGPSGDGPGGNPPGGGDEPPGAPVQG